MERQIRAAGRLPRMRTTLYAEVPAERYRAAFSAPPLAPVVNDAAAKLERGKGLLPGAVLPERGSLQAGTSMYEQVMLLAACN